MIGPLPILGEARRVLCLGAHPDDIEIGCSITVRRLVDAGAQVRWLVLTGDPARSAEARVSAGLHLGDPEAVTVHGFRDGYLPYEVPAAVKEAIAEHRSIFQPDLVFAPSRSDAHQDHRFLGELAWQLYRSHLILEYEIPKYDGDLGPVTAYVPVTAAEADRKIADLHAAYPSQHGKPWFDEALFAGLMRLRGMEASAPEGLAEAFTARKLVIG